MGKVQYKLRPFADSDEESLIRSINDRAVARNMYSIPHPYTLSDAREWLAFCAHTEAEVPRSAFHFAIEIDGEVAGGIGVYSIDVHKAEVGYWLARRYWGQGIMTRVVNEITRFGLRQLGLKKMYAYVFSYNPASKRVLEKAHYQTEGVLRCEFKKGRSYVDAFLMARLR